MCIPKSFDSYTKPSSVINMNVNTNEIVVSINLDEDDESNDIMLDLNQPSISFTSENDLRPMGFDEFNAKINKADADLFNDMLH